MHPFFRKKKEEKSMKNKKLRALTEGAVMLAVGLVLNSVPIFRLPNGG